MFFRLRGSLKSYRSPFDLAQAERLRISFVPFVVSPSASLRTGLSNHERVFPRNLAVAALVSISLLAALASAPASAQESQRIRYGVTASVAHLPVVVAKETGLFKKYGFDVEVIHIRGGALITMTIMSGSVQFSGAGAESVVAARIEGGDVVMLACPVDQDAVYLIARPEIKSAADLRGKATAVTRLGSTTHFYLRSALGQLGLVSGSLQFRPPMRIKAGPLPLDVFGRRQAQLDPGRCQRL